MRGVLETATTVVAKRAPGDVWYDKRAQRGIVSLDRPPLFCSPGCGQREMRRVGAHLPPCSGIAVPSFRHHDEQQSCSGRESPEAKPWSREARNPGRRGDASPVWIEDARCVWRRCRLAATSDSRKSSGEDSRRTAHVATAIKVRMTMWAARASQAGLGVSTVARRDAPARQEVAAPPAEAPEEPFVLAIELDGGSSGQAAMACKARPRRSPGVGGAHVRAPARHARLMWASLVHTSAMVALARMPHDMRASRLARGAARERSAIRYLRESSARIGRACPRLLCMGGARRQSGHRHLSRGCRQRRQPYQTSRAGHDSTPPPPPQEVKPIASLRTQQHSTSRARGPCGTRRRGFFHFLARCCLSRPGLGKAWREHVAAEPGGPASPGHAEVVSLSLADSAGCQRWRSDGPPASRKPVARTFLAGFSAGCAKGTPELPLGSTLGVLVRLVGSGETPQSKATRRASLRHGQFSCVAV